MSWAYWLKLLLFFCPAQEQVPQIVIRMGRVFHQNEAFLIAIRETLKSSQNVVTVSSKTYVKFLILFNFELVKQSSNVRYMEIQLYIWLGKFDFTKINWFLKFDFALPWQNEGFLKKLKKVIVQFFFVRDSIFWRKMFSIIPSSLIFYIFW